MNNHDERVTAVFEAAVLRDPAARASFLLEACGDDSALRHQVASMLADVDRPMVIDRPVGEAIAELMDDETPVVVGALVGPYRVGPLLGAGGMGAVYLATDTVLGRQVAIKVLPTDLAAEPGRVARFRREAQALAALNHPNVGAIYGFEPLDAGTGPAFGLVLELVEGATLAEKLRAGALPVDEALAVAQQIANALEAAHRQGIVHRDLKPGNIKLRDDGTVKVLDFGLAQVAGPSLSPDEGETGAVSSDDPPARTTSTPGMTAAGTILGTAPYMSPEQTTGSPVTGTTDIWAFGCVLYEMLTGSVAFTGDGTEPDFDRLPPTTPPGIRALLRHCLEKDPRRRWPDAGSLRFVLEDARVAPNLAAAAVTRTVNRRWVPVAAVALLAATALSAFVAWRLARQERPGLVARVLVGVSPASQVARTLDLPNARPFRSAIALSPDGQLLAFVGARPERISAASAARQLYVRKLERLDAMPIDGTDRAESPFFSPDGQWLGFWQAGSAGMGRLGSGELKKVRVAGGPVVRLCQTALPAGISWGPKGRIIFANHSGGGLWQVSDSGGTPEALTTPDLAHGELAHRLPHVLPDGSAVLFTIRRSPGGWDDTLVAVRSLVTGEQKVLVEGAADARFTTSGHLVYARMGTLLAQTFDVARLALTGKPVGVVDDVMQDVNSRFTIGNSGAAQFTVASNGTLAYLPGGVAPEGEYTAVWVDRHGAETEVGIPTLSVSGRPRISPDGRRIALSSLEGIGIFDVARRSFQLLTASAWGSPALRTAPDRRFVAWHADGERVTFTGVDGNLYWIRADGGGEAEPLAGMDGGPEPSRLRFPSAWSPDGRTLLFLQRLGSTGNVDRDIWTLTLGGAAPAVRPFLVSAADEPSAELSPDGRYVAYESNQSGQPEVYVQPFPGPGRREVVSIGGGAQPVWARNGRELFYRASQGPGRSMRMMAVDVTLGNVFAAGQPRVLWEADGARYPGGTGGRTYDVAPDGRRFLMIAQRDQPSPAITHIVLVQNWLAELTRLVPPN